MKRKEQFLGIINGLSLYTSFIPLLNENEMEDMQKLIERKKLESSTFKCYGQSLSDMNHCKELRIFKPCEVLGHYESMAECEKDLANGVQMVMRYATSWDDITLNSKPSN